LLDDRYELTEPLGSGGMAEVWRARDRRLGREVAVKLLAGSAAGDPSRRKRIAREARALAAADHPNIVSVYDYGEAHAGDDVVPYIVMELVDGPDLGRFSSERGPLPVDEVREIMLGILAGVERAHAAGVVHGDLKPGNVFIGSQGPKVGDFGVARILDEETGTTTLAATPSCAAPEVLRGERATHASDVYSVACLAYELLAGHGPFVGANSWEVVQKHIEEPAPRIKRVRPDVPADLDAILARALDKNPRRRVASVADLAVAFADADGADAAGTRPVATVPVSRTDATEAITARRPDPVRVALLGPLAGWWDAIVRRSRTLGDRRRALTVLTVLLAVALLVALLAVRNRGPEPVAVPKIEGRTVADASGILRTRGFAVDEVSYRPVTEGEAGIVLETIPAAGALVEPGSDVHIIASAFAATPEPVVEEDDDVDRKGGKGRRRGKGDDD
jgi:serine/threonine-protein kinase